MMKEIDLPTRAAIETAIAHGLIPDRCEVLQNASTLVLRLSETLVARVVTDIDGPRQGASWFARETAVAQHLAELGAPVIPLHPDLPPGPHEHLGYTLNFWQYVTTSDIAPAPFEVGSSLFHCHRVLRSFAPPLPELAILAESLALLEPHSSPRVSLGTSPLDVFSSDIAQMLRNRLVSSAAGLRAFPFQPLHGDAHPGNLMNTTTGLLWADWEDTFLGPVEWDVASIIWNALLLEKDIGTADAVARGYREAGGEIDPEALHYSLVGRAAVICTWYPILYPNASADRQLKLEKRLCWLDSNSEYIGMPWLE